MCEDPARILAMVRNVGAHVEVEASLTVHVHPEQRHRGSAASRAGSNQTVIHTTNSRILSFDAALLVRQHRMGRRATTGTVRRAQLRVVVKTVS